MLIRSDYVKYQLLKTYSAYRTDLINLLEMDNVYTAYRPPVIRCRLVHGWYIFISFQAVGGFLHNSNWMKGWRIHNKTFTKAIN